MDDLVSVSPTGELPSSLVSGGARNPSPSLPPMDGAGEMATGAAADLPLPVTKARGRPHPPAPAAALAAQWRPTLSSLRGMANDGPCCYGVPPWRCFSMRDGGRPSPSRAPAIASSVRCPDPAMDLVKVKVQSRVGERRGVCPHRPKIMSNRSTPAEGCLGCALLVKRSKGKFIKKARLMFIISSSGDLSQFFCTAAELQFTFHFESILDTSGKNYGRPNKNCVAPRKRADARQSQDKT